MTLNIASIWAALVTTGTAVLWLFTNIAWAGDVERIEARLIKAEIRDLRIRLNSEQNEAVRDYLHQELEYLIDELCDIKPDDRECN